MAPTQQTYTSEEQEVSAQKVRTMYITPTRVLQYDECARKFKLAQEWEYAGLVKPGPMELGSMFHHLMELYMKAHTRQINEESIMPEVEPEHQKEILDAWVNERYIHDMDKAVAEKEHVPYAMAMQRYVIAHLNREEFFKRFWIVCVEHTFEAVISGVPLEGTPDLIIQHRSTGIHGIVDWKTAGSLTRGLHAVDTQMNGYALLLEENGYQPYYGMHVRVKKIKMANRAKPPFVNIEEMRFNQTRLDAAKTRYEALIDKIVHDNLWSPSPTHLCMQRPCQFLEPCEAMDSTDDHEYVLSQTHVQIGESNGNRQEVPAPAPS